MSGKAKDTFTTLAELLHRHFDSRTLSQWTARRELVTLDNVGKLSIGDEISTGFYYESFLLESYGDPNLVKEIHQKEGIALVYDDKGDQWRITESGADAEFSGWRGTLKFSLYTAPRKDMHVEVILPE